MASSPQAHHLDLCVLGEAAQRSPGQGLTVCELRPAPAPDGHFYHVSSLEKRGEKTVLSLMPVLYLEKQNKSPPMIVLLFPANLAPAGLLDRGTVTGTLRKLKKGHRPEHAHCGHLSSLWSCPSQGCPSLSPSRSPARPLGKRLISRYPLPGPTQAGCGNEKWSGRHGGGCRLRALSVAPRRVSCTSSSRDTGASLQSIICGGNDLT